MATLRAIHKASEVRAGQRELEMTLTSQLPDLGKHWLTWRPNAVEMKLHGAGDGRLYFGHRLVGAEHKFWNSFGLFEEGRKNQRIVVEINFSVSRGRTAGLIASDPRGRRFMLHSGAVGGGRKGVSLETFLAWLKPELVDIEDANGQIVEAILIGELGALNLSSRIERFVRSVAAFKDAVSGGLLTNPDFVEQVDQWRDYRREFSGRKAGAVIVDLDYVSYHGDVVDALRQRVEAKVRPTDKVTNSRLIDLLVHRNGDLVEVYEVKTTTARQALYTGIGQLMVHSKRKDVTRTIVVPQAETIAADIAAALAGTRIRLVRYSIDSDDVVRILD